MPSGNSSFLLFLFFAKCIEQSLFIKMLMISNRICTMWIMLNLSDLQSFLILIFAKVQLRNSNLNTSVKKFRQATAIINLLAIAQFFKATCTGIFKRLLAAKFTEDGLFGLVSTYFGKVEINS